MTVNYHSRTGGVVASCENSGSQDFLKQLRLLEVLLGGRRLFVTVVVIVITSAAADLGRLRGHNRDDGMVGNPAALNAMIVDYIP